MNLKFSIKEQVLTRQDEEKIAGYTQGYIDAVFDFDKNWINLQKYALFSEPDGTKHVLYLGYGKELSCKIPQQVLMNVLFYVSVFAENLLTSSQETVLVSPSGYVSDIDDLEEGDIIDGSLQNDFIYYNKNYDEYIEDRRDYYERAEHPYV